MRERHSDIQNSLYNSQLNFKQYQTAHRGSIRNTIRGHPRYKLEK